MDLLNQIRILPAYQALLNALKSRQLQPGLALPRAARLPVLAALYKDLDQPILLVTDRADHALQLHDELAFWLPEVTRYIFSEPNPLFYEEAAWGTTTRRERLQALTALSVYHLPFAQKPNTPPVIITSARALMTRTLPRRDFLKASRLLKAGQSIPPGALLNNWVSMGYQPADTVLEAGQFSHRGGLLDVWPPSEPDPVRLDFFGDEIDTIRRFEPGSQRTVEKLESVLVTPAREFLLPNDELFDQETPYSEFNIPVLHPNPSSLLDYLPQNAQILVDDLSILESAVSEIEEQAVKLRSESIAEGTLDEGFPVPYISWSELNDILEDGNSLELGRSTADEEESEHTPGETLSAQFGQIERFGGRLKPFIEYLSRISAGDNPVVIVSRQSSRLEELWMERAVDAAQEAADHHKPVIEFIDASLSEGWSLVSNTQDRDQGVTNYLITDSEIFGWETASTSPKTQTRGGNSRGSLCGLASRRLGCPRGLRRRTLYGAGPAHARRPGSRVLMRRV